MERMLHNLKCSSRTSELCAESVRGFVFECIKQIAEVLDVFVNEIMSKCVMECTEDAGLEEVYDLIRKCEHGLVVVVDSHAHRVPIGVVSERSICEQIIVRGRNPRNLTAGTVIDSRIKTVREDDLIETIGMDEARSLSAIVVTDSNRQVSGVLALNDLSAARAVTRIPTATRPVPEIPAFGWVQ
jgi:predicted transcriptional regulator